MNMLEKAISDLISDLFTIVAILVISVVLMSLSVFLGNFFYDGYRNYRLQNAYYRLSEASRGDSLEKYRDALHDFNKELMIAFPNGEKVNPTEYK